MSTPTTAVAPRRRVAFALWNVAFRARRWLVRHRVAVKLTLDEHYVVPDQMKHWVNYTVIQTGVNLAITATMWVGMSLIVLGGAVFLLRKKREGKGKQ